MKFSIILPVHTASQERREQLQRAVQSIANQTYPNTEFQLFLVNDGSPLEFEVPDTHWLVPVSIPHGERVIAYNKGFKKALGEWFCLLNSDDEYVPSYLERVACWIEKYPSYRMFNFGCLYAHKDGKITFRNAFAPKRLTVGHEVFGGGNVVDGTFVFSRKIHDELGGYPPDVIKNIDCSEINYGGVRDLYMNTPYDFSAAAQIEFPEIRQYFMVDHEAEPKKIIKELGNPYGQDFYLFYKYTRVWHSKPINEYLYVVHPK